MPFKPGQFGNAAGRPPGVRDYRLKARDQAMADISARIGADHVDLDAHGFLVAVYREPALPIELRVDAAKSAIRFERPALSASNVTGDITHHVSIADQLARARRRVLTIDVPAQLEPAE